jgi:hypothetical protein
MTQSQAELLKKITTKLVWGDKVNVTDVKEGSVQLYSIIGVCTGFKVGESPYGGWVGFTGQFEATRIKDQKKFIAPVAFIPEPASSMMLASVNRALANKEDPNIQFAFIIGAKKSTAAIGFEYTVEPVMEAAQNDVMADLRKRVEQKLLPPVEEKQSDNVSHVVGRKR